MSNVDIRPVEIDGRHWVNIVVDGHELARRGPYSTADEAEAAATQIGATCRALLRGEVRIGGAPALRPRA